MEHLIECGVWYRHLKENELPKNDEVILKYEKFHHPTQTHHGGTIAMPNFHTNYKYKLLTLLNLWNCQPKSGWSYYC